MSDTDKHYRELIEYYKAELKEKRKEVKKLKIQVRVLVDILKDLPIRKRGGDK